MTKNNLTTLPHGAIDWDNLHGPVTIPMTNDYLFRALLQRNNKVLKALICSLLHLKISDVESVTITNPIELGKSTYHTSLNDQKTYYPDTYDSDKTHSKYPR